MKLFNDSDVYTVYNNFVLSKYKLLLQPNMYFSFLNLGLDLKYTFKNLDETLVIFWLFYIINNNNAPKVKFSKFNKKVCYLSIRNTSFEFLSVLLEDFLYNTKYSSLKRKKVKYISGEKFMYSYLKKKDVYFFRHFSAVFKQNYLEYIFSDLGISGIKLLFKVNLRPLKKRFLLSNNINFYKDIIALYDVEKSFKQFMFEEISIY
jgi:hypothetical protein